MIIDLVIGDKSNFLKASAMLRAGKDFNLLFRLIVSGEDQNFKDDGLSDSIQISTIRKKMSMDIKISNFETWFIASRPDYLMTIGNSESTRAAIAAARLEEIKIIAVDGD